MKKPFILLSAVCLFALSCKKDSKVTATQFPIHANKAWEPNVNTIHF